MEDKFSKINRTTSALFKVTVVCGVGGTLIYLIFYYIMPTTFGIALAMFAELMLFIWANYYFLFRKVEDAEKNR